MTNRQHGRYRRRLVGSPSREAFTVAAAVALLAVALLAPLTGVARAALDKVVVTLGADLDSSQQQQMLDLFGVDRGTTTVIEVTNAEERRYLEGAVPDAQLGTRAISSAYVHVKSDGSGIKVQTKHITYVTARTYANALATAGVKDADVYAAAPFDVSGTAALTGVFKAFEEATGKPIPEASKEVATQELVDTAAVGEQVGNADAIAQLVEQVKLEIVKQGLKDPAAIREVVVRIAAELKITLTDAQIDQLVQMLVQVQSLNLDLGKLQQQMKDFQDKIGLTNEQAQGIWQSLRSFFTNIWTSIFG
jgi:uncharacterized protein YpuA (DUF1002 family)